MKSKPSSRQNMKTTNPKTTVRKRIEIQRTSIRKGCATDFVLLSFSASSSGLVVTKPLPSRSIPNLLSNMYNTAMQININS